MKEIRRLGVFDSGLGGLTVLNEICKYNRGLEISYFGDTARVPYGSRSDETILAYARQDVRFLQSRNVDAIVVACGTVSAIALNSLKSELDFPIFGVIESAANAAIAATKTRSIGIIGTIATIRSGAYMRTIKAKDGDARVYGVACPLLVPLIENGHAPDDEIVELACKRYLSEFKDSGVDTVIMGCTHYPFYKQTLKRLAPEITFIDIGTALAKDLKRLLNLAPSGEGKVEYFVSDSDTGFQAIANGFLDSVRADFINSVNIERY
ncbi:MAG: glutamate racemase [Clostridia bacterium]|nr:glutamate racemase [Clostridia bacterium]